MIGLLLGGKLSMHMLGSSTTEEAAITTTPAAPVMFQVEPLLTATIKPQTAEAGVEESLLMLENYIFPQAQAAISDAQASPNSNQLVLEDKTLIGLRDYKEQLDARTRQLDQREKSIQEAEDQVKRRITELEQLEASIQQRLNDESKVKNKKIKRLAAVYEGMKPESAAPVIAKMELVTVVKIFLLMEEKRVGKILSFLPPDKAVAISQALTRQISTVK